MRYSLPLGAMIATAFLSAFGAATSLLAADLEWARFRGPDGSGIGAAPHFPAEFSEASFNWKIELPGPGHSSPVIAGDRVFVTCTPPNTAKRILLAVNTKDGSIAWQREWETESFRQHADNSYTSASPAVDSERVYVWWTSPTESTIAALDQRDGREVWKSALGGFVSQHGSGSSPIVFEDTVILDFGQEAQDGKNSYTVCFDAKSGAIRWKTERVSSSSTASTPLIYLSKGASPQLILISRSSGLTSLDPHTGARNWEIPDLLSKRCVASPIETDSGLIIAQCGEGTSESFVYAVRPSPDGKSAQKVYEVNHSGGYVPSPIAVGSRLYLWKENGYVTCLNAETGEQIWSERTEGPFYGSPVALNGRLYAITRRGDLVILPMGDHFTAPARLSLGEGSFATPAVAGGRMYLRTFTHLISAGEP